jgi:hypothetical protein
MIDLEREIWIVDVENSTVCRISGVVANAQRFDRATGCGIPEWIAMQEPYQVSPLTIYEYVTPDLLDSDPLEGTMLASTRGHSAAVVARWSLRNSFTTNRIKLSKKKPPMVKQYTNSPQVLQSYGQFVATPEVTSE